MKSSSGNEGARWSLVTNHGRVLAHVAGDPDARLKDIAEAVGITERTAGQIVTDLERAGHLSRTRAGRRTRYAIDGTRKVKTPALPTMTVASLLALLLEAVERQPLA